MGVDLFLILYEEHEDGSAHGYTILELERRSRLWPVIGSLEKAPAPNALIGFPCVNEEHEWHPGQMVQDANGDRLYSVYAGNLKPLSSHSDVQGSVKNRAVWAYLHCLPDKHPVLLYWW